MAKAIREWQSSLPDCPNPECVQLLAAAESPQKKPQKKSQPCPLNSPTTAEQP
jgi:hypothetical protein